MAFYGAYLAIWALIGRGLGYGWPYGTGIAIAALMACWHFTLIRERSREGCFRAFRLNHWIGCAVFAGVVAQHALR
jgi:4-hydroxybenzoate polyprenyltransferase